MVQTSLNEMLRAAEIEIAAGHPEQALILCQEAQVRYPRSLHVQRVLGEVYLAQRKTREAVAALDRALAGNPEDARACCARAIVQQIQGDSLGALAWYRRACDIRPNDQVLRSAYRELATSLRQPVYEPTRLGLAALYLRSNLLPHAIREWEAILAEDADSVAAQVGLIVTLWRAGSTAAAAERCRRTLLNTPTCVKALLVLALVEKQAGNVQETERLMRRAGELDPEIRIARELFADQITAGDPVVHELLGIEREVALPAPPRPAVTAGPPPESHAQPVGTVPLPPPVPVPAAETRLPPNFGRIFDETRDMLWRDEDNEIAERRLSDQQSERPQVDMFARSNIYIPPVMRERGANLEDTETRVAINWLSWLQAQGAIPQPGMQRAPSSRTLRPNESLPASGDYGNGDIVTGPLPPWVAGAAPQTGTLPPPTPEALRAMFAELEPDNRGRIVEGEVVSAAPSSGAQQPDASDTYSFGDDGRDEHVEAETERSDFAAPWEEETGAYTGVSAMPEELDNDAGESEEWRRDDTGAGELDNVETGMLDASLPKFATPVEAASPTIDEHTEEEHTEPDAFPAPEEPLTLEALERDFAASGFQSYDLQPGTLHAIAAEQAAERASEPPSPEPAGTTEPITPPLMPRPTYAPLPAEPVDDSERAEPERAGESFASTPDIPDIPAEAPTDDAPVSTDYPARLDLARKRRGAGQLDDALAEYRAVLKNAPDLLPEVVSDLEQSVAETPDHPELHRLLGDARVRQGDYLSALESYNRAVALAQNQGTSN